MYLSWWQLIIYASILLVLDYFWPPEISATVRVFTMTAGLLVLMALLHLTGVKK